VGRFRLKNHNFSVCIILRHAVYIPQYFPNVCSYHLKKVKVDIFNDKQVMELFRNSGTPVYRVFSKRRSF
jgi:hypothetical protein